MIFIDVKNSLFHFAYMKQEGKKNTVRESHELRTK